MGGSSGQVVGYRYFTNLLLFIGNPIENLIAINFDKRGWIDPFTDEDENILDPGVINSPSLYGETEGGVAGAVYLKTGTNDQGVVPFYKDYMESKELQASAYPYQSYLAFKDFYVGNSGYMKEMLLWPKRIHVRNDGRVQWYDSKSEIPEGGGIELPSGPPTTEPLDIPGDLSISRNLKVGDDVILNEPEIGDVADKTLRFWGGGWSTSGITYLKFGSYRSIASLPYSRWIGSIRVNAKGNSSNINITGAVFSEIDNLGYEVYSIDFTGEFFSISIDVSETFAIEWSYLNLQRFYAPPPKIDSGDINPIHKIREILTDDTAMNKPESSINNENFIKAADRIWSEGLGVSWSITEKSCLDAINELCYHIEAGIRVNRQTGLYEMILFRDNWFDESEIHTIAENKIKKGSMQYEITNADEVINQVNVNYYDRANIKNSSFSISESGLIQTLGRVNAETVDFPYFMNMRNAEIVANWKLKILSTGVLKGSFTTGWREARKWNRYDLIKLPWSKRWVGSILVRIMSIKLGGPTSNDVSIEWVEVVPATGMMNTTIIADDVIDKPLPPQACQYEPFEMPYYLAVMALGQRKADEDLAYESNFGLVGTVAEKPQENSLYAVMMTNNGDEWVRAGSIQYSETADLDQIISKTSSSFTVKNWKKIANVLAGTLIKCGRDWLGTPGEWMVFQGVDPYTGIVSVKRGALDTPPQEWGIDTKLYFCGNDVSYDQTEYVSGEEVLVSALTTTPSGVLEQGGSIPIEMKARAIRPYPPANVKINGKYWPAYFENDLVVSWANRNRLQQTGGEIIGWFDNGVTLETGVTCQLILTEFDENDIELVTQNANVTAVNTFTLAASSMNTNTRKIKIVLKTIRDGFECLYPFEHTILFSNLTAPSNVDFEVIEV